MNLQEIANLDVEQWVKKQILEIVNTEGVFSDTALAYPETDPQYTVVTIPSQDPPLEE